MKAAIVQETSIDPERDAGARAIKDLADSFTRIGFETILLVDNPNLEDALTKFSADVIIVSQPSTMIRARNFRTDFNVPVVYWAQDLHAKRMSLGEGVEGASASGSLAMSLKEQLAISSADLAVFPTKEDSDAARRKYSVSNLEQHQYFSIGSSLPIHEPKREDTLVFIGGPAHLPNLDGLRWFLKDCWPLIQDKEKSVKLQIIGSWQDSEIYKQFHDGVAFTGQLAEDEVRDVMRNSLIGISPLRFGAGMKRKTLQYLEYGLALLSTDFGLQGLPRSQDNKSWLRANTKIDFVDATIRLIQKPETTKEMAKSGNEFVKKSFSEEAFDLGLERILTKVNVLRP
ncbi:MAG: glycosyltransferase [Rhodoluna sp.]|nr:glycosyltransferase [Rhodoluna sp.]